MTHSEEPDRQVEAPPAEASDNLELAEPVEKSQLARWLLKLRWRAHWLSPNLIPNPYGHDSAYEETHDQEENEKSRIPIEQELRCQMIWGVELYGPAEIESLYEGMTKLDWVRVGAVSAQDSAAKRIREQRSYGAGGWFNIGRVLPHGRRGTHLLANNFAPLPDGVESLLVRVFQITASLTAVLVGFQLAEPLVSRYESEVNRDRRTFRRRTHRPRAIEWVEPWHQKREAVEAFRSELRSLPGKWFARHLPGYFCGLKRPSEFPTMELLISQGQILEEPKDDSRDGWMGWRRLLANTPPHELWTYQDNPGLQLAFERHHDKREGLHILVALDAKTFPEEKLKHVGGSTASAYGWLCHEILGGALMHSATIEYLNEHIRDLSLTRESMKKARSGRRNISRTLDEIGRFFDRTLGSPAIARELAKHSKNLSWYRHDCENFTTPGWAKGDEPIKLHVSICERVRYLSSQLTDEEAALRGHFEQLTTILSVRESIKAQHRMEWLTVIAVVAALVALAPSSWRDETIKRVESLWASGISAAQK